MARSTLKDRKVESVKNVAAKPRKSVRVDPRTRQEPAALATPPAPPASPASPAAPAAQLALLALLGLLALLALVAVPNRAAVAPQRLHLATAVAAVTVACHVSPAAVP